MKKILALTLAAVMTAGMTTTAFAAFTADDEDTVVLADFNGDLYDENAYLFVLDDDGVATERYDGGLLEGGDRLAIPLVYVPDAESDETIDWYTSASDYDKSLTVYEDWDDGETEADVQLIRYDLSDYAEEIGDENLTTLLSGRVYSVVITLPENDSGRVDYLAGTVQVGRTRSSARNSDYIYSLNISYAPAGEEIVYYNGETLYAGETGIYCFNDDGEIDIEFDEDALFTVDVTGQGRLNLAWNTDFNSEIAALDTSVNMDFITFEGEPSFNRTGTLYIYADADTYLYEVVDGELQAADAEYNEDYEAWEFRTRTLGEYVIADGEIDLEAITETEDDTTTDGGKVNPDTGR